MITIIGAFGIITVISSSNEAANLEDYKGLFWRKPFLAAVFTTFLLSLAGIPLTAGFMGKYFLLTAGLGKTEWPLAFVLVVSSVIGLFYYLRVIVAMMKPNEDIVSIPTSFLRPPIGGILMLTFLGALVIVLGIYPEWLIAMVKTLNP
jgi:NADH-quinone oxidoreductase subunit N